MPLTRRNFLTTTAAGSLATSFVGGGHDDLAADEPEASRPEARRADPRAPNILWICTDQQRYDTIGSLNNPHLRTPHLDRLVSQGVAFTHAYCQSPICTPSRASFLTGHYPSTLRNCINGNASWSDARPLVTRLLADAGYDCGLAGKYHLSSAQGRIEPRADDGYREFHWSHHPPDDWPKGHAYADWLKSQGANYTKLHKRLGYIPTELHQTTWCANQAIQFMRQERDRPWLFSFNCFDPHPPFDPPKEFVDRFDVAKLPGPLFRESDLAAQARLAQVNFQSKPERPEKLDCRKHQAMYWAQIELIDQNVGRMLDALEETGQRDNTIVIFTSDHGDATGDHGLRAKGCRFYEGLVRVPLIISCKSRFRSGVRGSALVELTDLAPTLLDAAGVAGSEKMQGRSLLPILSGTTPADQHRETVRSEYYRVLDGPQTYATMIRDGRFKLVAYHGLNLGELFDLENDPGEFDNLWDDSNYADVRFKLLSRNFDALALATDTGSERVGRY